MKMPNQIKVCGHTYDIETMGRALSIDMKCVGDFDREQLRIRIADFLAPSKKAETLLHEILHAVTDAAGLMDKSGATDEDVVNPVARILFSVIQDNHELAAYLQNPE